MYTLAYSDNNPNFARVFYTTPCGEFVRVADIEFLDGEESGVLVVFPKGKSSLKTVGEIYRIVKLELDTRKNS